MPTYEYQCLDCKRKVEYFQSMKEPPRTKCTRCGGKLVRLVSTGTGLIFKGNGFYITDYKHKEAAYTSKLSNNGRHGKDNSSSRESKKAETEKQTEKVKTGGSQ